VYLTGDFRRQKQLNKHIMTIKDPFLTTVRRLKSTSPSQTSDTLRKIQDKLVTYGIVSDREQAYLERWTDFGKTDQKERF
jgi:hypothetical protein